MFYTIELPLGNVLEVFYNIKAACLHYETECAMVDGDAYPFLIDSRTNLPVLMEDYDKGFYVCELHEGGGGHVLTFGGCTMFTHLRYARELVAELGTQRMFVIIDGSTGDVI